MFADVSPADLNKTEAEGPSGIIDASADLFAATNELELNSKVSGHLN